ncbi:MAG: hypothetical protein J5527_07935 [Treponema sp.]|nr:hypothetical protein [Treponema sp.]
MPSFYVPDKSLLSPTQNDYAETARYLGYRKTSLPDDQIAALIDECIRELYSVISPQAVYDFFELETVHSQTISFADVKIVSVDLARNLNGCTKVALLAATIGPQVDAAIRRCQTLNPAKASVMQAAGAMYIEKFVDLVNDEIKKAVCDSAAGKDVVCKPRFSPGFGDVSLEVQKDFFRLLPCARIGLTLMDSLIMSPEKSVTAFVGSGSF